jgi:hypothetical protein
VHVPSQWIELKAAHDYGDGLHPATDAIRFDVRVGSIGDIVILYPVVTTAVGAIVTWIGGVPCAVFWLHEALFGPSTDWQPVNRKTPMRITSAQRYCTVRDCPHRL